jgi:cation diffusion facilitator CzcD-associated flavoprotein CzcO
MESQSREEKFKVVIIGAGWNGIGVGAAFKKNGMEDFVILEMGKKPAWFWSEHYDSLSLHSPNHELWNSPPALRSKYSFLKSKNEVVDCTKIRSC